MGRTLRFKNKPIYCSTCISQPMRANTLVVAEHIAPRPSHNVCIINILKLVIKELIAENGRVACSYFRVSCAKRGREGSAALRSPADDLM